MTDTSTSPNTYKTRKTLDLSPRAAAMLLLPVQARGYELLDAGGALIGSIDHFGDNTLDASFATFVAGLVNEALTPAAGITIVPGWAAELTKLRPQAAVTIIPETNTELNQLVTNEIEAAEWPGVRMCADPECLNGADPTTPNGAWCQQHAAARWTAEEIMRREG